MRALWLVVIILCAQAALAEYPAGEPWTPDVVAAAYNSNPAAVMDVALADPDKVLNALADPAARTKFLTDLIKTAPGVQNPSASMASWKYYLTGKAVIKADADRIGPILHDYFDKATAATIADVKTAAQQFYERPGNLYGQGATTYIDMVRGTSTPPLALLSKEMMEQLATRGEAPTLTNGKILCNDRKSSTFPCIDLENMNGPINGIKVLDTGGFSLLTADHEMTVAAQNLYGGTILRLDPSGSATLISKDALLDKKSSVRPILTFNPATTASVRIYDITESSVDPKTGIWGPMVAVGRKVEFTDTAGDKIAGWVDIKNGASIKPDGQNLRIEGLPLFDFKGRKDASWTSVSVEPVLVEQAPPTKTYSATLALRDDGWAIRGMVRVGFANSFAKGEIAGAGGKEVTIVKGSADGKDWQEARNGNAALFTKDASGKDTIQLANEVTVQAQVASKPPATVIFPNMRNAYTTWNGPTSWTIVPTGKDKIDGSSIVVIGPSRMEAIGQSINMINGQPVVSLAPKSALFIRDTLLRQGPELTAAINNALATMQSELDAKRAKIAELQSPANQQNIKDAVSEQEKRLIIEQTKEDMISIARKAYVLGGSADDQQKALRAAPPLILIDENEDAQAIAMLNIRAALKSSDDSLTILKDLAKRAYDQERGGNSLYDTLRESLPPEEAAAFDAKIASAMSKGGVAGLRELGTAAAAQRNTVKTETARYYDVQISRAEGLQLEARELNNQIATLKKNADTPATWDTALRYKVLDYYQPAPEVTIDTPDTTYKVESNNLIVQKTARPDQTVPIKANAQIIYSQEGSKTTFRVATTAAELLTAEDPQARLVLNKPLEALTAVVDTKTNTVSLHFPADEFIRQAQLSFAAQQAKLDPNYVGLTQDPNDPRLTLWKKTLVRTAGENFWLDYMIGQLPYIAGPYAKNLPEEALKGRPTLQLQSQAAIEIPSQIGKNLMQQPIAESLLKLAKDSPIGTMLPLDDKTAAGLKQAEAQLKKGIESRDLSGVDFESLDMQMELPESSSGEIKLTASTTFKGQPPLQAQPIPIKLQAAPSAQQPVTGDQLTDLSTVMKAIDFLRPYAKDDAERQKLADLQQGTTILLTIYAQKPALQARAKPLMEQLYASTGQTPPSMPVPSTDPEEQKKIDDLSAQLEAAMRLAVPKTLEPIAARLQSPAGVMKIAVDQVLQPSANLQQSLARIEELKNKQKELTQPGVPSK